MDRNVRVALGVTAVGLVLGASAVMAVEQAASPAGLLDGKVFQGEIGSAREQKGDADELSFAAGTFHSSACDRYGFSKGTYTATPEGDAVAFQAETVSPTDGKMMWKGTVRGTQLEGHALWSRAGHEPQEYWVKGTLKQQAL